MGVACHEVVDELPDEQQSHLCQRIAGVESECSENNNKAIQETCDILANVNVRKQAGSISQ